MWQKKSFYSSRKIDKSMPTGYIIYTLSIPYILYHKWFSSQNTYKYSIVIILLIVI